MRKYLLTLLLALSASIATVCAEPVDSAFINLNFPASTKYFDIFAKKVNTTIREDKGRVNILHIGGSHVQGGTYPHTLRTKLSSIATNAAADRGIVFPFKAIKTNAPSNYTITPTGQWSRSRNISATPDAVLGLSGAAAITGSTDCSLTVDLKDNGKWAFSDIRLLGYTMGQGVIPYVTVDDDVKIYADEQDQKPGYLFHLPKQTNRCKIGFEGLSQTNKFVVRGMIPMSDRSGITYIEAGVNGAATISWLRCPVFNEELSLLPPDMAIFGIGINDADGPGFNVDKFKDNYRKIISNLRKLNPNIALIFITNNDCRHAKKYNPNTPIAEQAFIELAREHDGAVFNVFRIMGGPLSAEQWVSAKLMEPDRVHFTPAGYRLLGNMLGDLIVEYINK